VIQTIDMEDYIEWMVLSQLPGVGPTGFWQFVEYFGTPEAALSSSRKELRQVPGIRASHLRGFDQADIVREKCCRQLDLLQEIGGCCLTGKDREYPQLLLEIADPPPLLYLLGDKKLMNSCCIGVVGSRAATSYGHRTAFTLAKRLAENGVTIVSGLALGIDSESHKGALAVNGNTIAVLGCGLDVIYPRQNKKLFQQITGQGVIVTENPLGTPPEGFRFPARNRIIAGMSRGVLVVEAARKSGSLITAQIALDEGRDVYAVPGQVDSFKSEGTHWLL
jgi:DNA processing protein